MKSMVKYGVKTFTKIVGINNEGANGSALKVVEINIAVGESYFVVGDIFTILPKDIVAFVKDVGVANGNETITLKKADGTNWKATDVTTSSKIKHEWYPIPLCNF